MDREQLIEEVMNAIQKIRARHRERRHSEESNSGRGMILNYLYAHGGQATPGELRDHMKVTTPRVTVILNELEQEKLIVREIADYDRRRVCVNLTEHGRQSVEQRRMRRREQIGRLVDRLGEEDTQALLRICRVLDDLDEDTKR